MRGLFKLGTIVRYYFCQNVDMLGERVIGHVNPEQFLFPTQQSALRDISHDLGQIEGLLNTGRSAKEGQLANL